ncbi:hypothetical protein L0F63_000657 [Massospora cicadina]|nr:hypothetical protein L0F63_000657 [Massospora cicadina]
MEKSKDKNNNLLGRLDNLTWSSWHTKLTLILGTGWAFDAYEVSIVTSVLPVIKKHFELNATEASVPTMVWLIGILFGAIGFGYFGDRFGRKLSFVVTIVGYSIMTVVAALSPTRRSMHATEFIPSRHRGKVNTLVMSFWAVGALVANGLQYPILTYLGTDISWRVGFATGGTAAIFVLIARKSLPESPRWLISQGRIDEAAEIVASIEKLSGQPDNGDLVTDCPAPVVRGKLSYWQVVKQLFRNYPYRILFGMVMNATQAFADYGESNLMALGVLGHAGITGADVSLFYLFGTLSTIPAYLAAAYLIDKIGRKLLLPLLYINGIIASAVFIPAIYSKDIKSAITGAHCYYQLSPTHLRATGIGLSVAAGRIVASVSPFILISIYEKTGNGANLVGAVVAIIAFLALGLLMALSWAKFGVEGKNRSLEAMES